MKCLVYAIFFFASFSQVEAGWLKQILGTEYIYKETTFIDLPQEEVGYWKQAYCHATENGMSIVEWVPYYETLDSRTQLLTFQFYANHGTRQSAQEFAGSIFEQSKERYPDMEWKTIKSTDSEVVYEWTLPQGIALLGLPVQQEIAKIIITPQGMHRVAYERRGGQMTSQERELWLWRVMEARIISR